MHKQRHRYEQTACQGPCPDSDIILRCVVSRQCIFSGAWVTLEDEDGNELICRIVGPDEFDARKGLNRMDAPLARAAKRTFDDEIEIRTSSGVKRYREVEVEYRQDR